MSLEIRHLKPSLRFTLGFLFGSFFFRGVFFFNILNGGLSVSDESFHGKNAALVLRQSREVQVECPEVFKYVSWNSKCKILEYTPLSVNSCPECPGFEPQIKYSFVLVAHLYYRLWTTNKNEEI